MLVLAAPHTDDPRDDGFVHTLPGELLHRPFVCNSGHEGTCGCERSWIGITSRKATTLAEVIEMDIDPATYTGLIAGVLADDWDRADAEEETGFLADIAADFDTGTLLTLTLDHGQHVIEEIEI